MQSAVHSITKRKSEGDGGGGAAAASGGSPSRDEVNGDSDGTDDDYGSDDDGYLSLSGGGAAAAAARAKSSESISEGWTNVAPSAMAYPGLEVGMTRCGALLLHNLCVPACLRACPRSFDRIGFNFCPPRLPRPPRHNHSTNLRQVGGSKQAYKGSRCIWRSSMFWYEHDRHISFTVCFLHLNIGFVGGY